METAVLVWNGNSVIGNMQIQSFLEKLPASDHQVVSLDAQPIHGMPTNTDYFCYSLLGFNLFIFNAEEAIKGQPTVMAVVAGIVRFDKKPGQPFSQNFLITAQDTKWKVVSDCLRFQQVLS